MSIKTIVLSIYFSFCALFGGVLLPALGTAAPLIVWVSIGVLCAVLLITDKDTKPILAVFFAPIWIALVISAAIHTGPGWIAPISFTVAGMVWFAYAAHLGGDTIKRALYYASSVYLTILGPLMLVGLKDNRNLIGFWAALFLIIAIDRRAKWHALAFALLVVITGSRGAMLAAAVGVLVYFRPQIDPRRVAAWAGLALIAFFILATAARPGSTITRVEYAKISITALAESPLIGIGPGGYLDKAIIYRPPSYNIDRHKYTPEFTQAHAHNGLLHYITETGLMGAAALGLGGWLLYRKRGRVNWQGWPWAALAAALAHSLVDWPMFYFGPLVVFMTIAGTVENKQQ